MYNEATAGLESEKKPGSSFFKAAALKSVAISGKKHSESEEEGSISTAEQTDKTTSGNPRKATVITVISRHNTHS